MNYPVKLMDLDVGDFVLSDRVAVERKTFRDFTESMKDGRIFDQLYRLKSTYEVPILILEGRRPPANFRLESFYGAIASVVADFGVTVLMAVDARHVAEILVAISKRECQEGRVPKIRFYKPTMTKEERMRYIVEGLPEVSAVLARRLLDHFGSVHAIFNATVEELMQVRGIGKEKAERIYAAIHMDWPRKNSS